MRPTDYPAVAAALVVVVATVWGGAFAPTSRLAVTAALAIVVGWAAAVWRERLAAEEWLALGVIGWGALSAVVGPRYPLAAKETLTSWLLAWLLLVLVRRSGAKARGAVLVLAVTGAAVTAAGVLGASLAGGRLGLGGLYRNPNVAVALVVPAVAFLWTERERKGEGWRWLLVALVGAAVLASGSRAGLLALVAAVAVAAPRRRGRWLVVAAAAVGGAGIVVWRFLAHPDALAWYRPAIWGALAKLVVAHPVLGIGPGWLEDATGVVRLRHVEAIASFQHVIGSAESSLLGLVVRTGVGGAALAAAAVVAWARRMGRDRIEQRRAGLAVLAAVGVMGVFHDLLDQGVVLWQWALLVGCLFPVAGPPAVAADRARPTARGARLAAALAATWLVLWGAAEPAYARRLWWRGASSVELAQRSLRADPWFAEPAEWVTSHLLGEPRWTWERAGEALSWSRLATELHGGSAGAWSDFGLVNARIVEEVGPWPDAVAGARQGYQRATELEPHLPWHWLRWAQLERMLGHPARALELGRRAVQEEPSFACAWLFVGRVELDLGQEGPARDALQRALEAHGRAQGRELTPYEEALVTLPLGQVEQLEAAVGGDQAPTTPGAGG